MAMDRRRLLLLAAAVLGPLALLWLIPLFAFPGGTTWPVDVMFTNWVHGLTNPSLTAVMKWFSAVGYHNVQFWIAGGVGLYFLVRRMRILPGLALLAARYGSLWLGEYLKDLFARPRPQLEWLSKPPTGLSYPSGTVTIGATYYIMLAYLIAGEIENLRLRRAVQASGWVFAGLISLSRIYLGAHWLTDTVAGLCVAASITAALSFLLTVPLPRPAFLRPLEAAAAADMRRRR